MRKYVIWSVILIMFSAGVVLGNSAPVVSNVTVSQQTDGSGIVNIYYWLSDADGDVCTVSIVVSNDGGSTWTVNPTAFSGSSAVGQVTPSAGSKKITWYSKVDLPGTYGSNYCVKVCADDGQTGGPAGMFFVTIPSGTFQMGDSFSEESYDEHPVHTVTLSSFKMSKYEITNGQYAEFLNSAYPTLIKVVGGVIYAVSDASNSYPYSDLHSYDGDSQIDFSGGVFSVMPKGGRSMINDPMVQLSWYGADAFCDYYGYRLPTEAEWEYAARGGISGNRFPWGNTINHNYANYRANSSNYSYDTSPYTTYTYHPTWNDGIYPYTSPVGSFSANGYGLYDMVGNAQEWCSDWHSSSYYSNTPQINPTGPSSGSRRVLRGGGWNYVAYFCRVACRTSYPPHISGVDFMGFRVCQD